MNINEELKSLLSGRGACDIGFCSLDRIADGVDTGGMTHAVSIVFRLSSAVIGEITDRPTHTYFHHYRTVNAALDSMALSAGQLLERHGYRYIAVAASQTVEKTIDKMRGRISHKMIASMCGLGSIGKNALFLHQFYGPAVRLCTVLTDAPLSKTHHTLNHNLCKGCDECVRSCPAGALSGKTWSPDETIVDAKACSEYMKRAFIDIGRGAVCGICIKVCPAFTGG